MSETLKIVSELFSAESDATRTSHFQQMKSLGSINIKTPIFGLEKRKKENALQLKKILKIALSQIRIHCLSRKRAGFTAI